MTVETQMTPRFWPIATFALETDARQKKKQEPCRSESTSRADMNRSPRWISIAFRYLDWACEPCGIDIFHLAGGRRQAAVTRWESTMGIKSMNKNARPCGASSLGFVSDHRISCEMSRERCRLEEKAMKILSFLSLILLFSAKPGMCMKQGLNGAHIHVAAYNVSRFLRIKIAKIELVN